MIIKNLTDYLVFEGIIINLDEHNALANLRHRNIVNCSSKLEDFSEIGKHYLK